ncbi:MAG TPA: hypothetical protein VGM93_10470 [Acidimicrobiales bacterium]
MADPVAPSPDPDRASARRRERRPFWIAFGVMFGSMLLAAVVAYATAGHSGDPNPTAQANAAREASIPLPGSGHRPTNPGDPGGWEQLLTLGLIVIGVTGLGLLAWRSAAKAREGRKEWLETARRGREDQQPASIPSSTASSRAPPTDADSPA